MPCGDQTDATRQAGADALRKCTFFIKRKNRCCTAVAAPGIPLCPLHERERRASTQEPGATFSAAASVAEGAADPLVPCPHNGNHSVLTSRMQRHLRVCPDRLRDPRLLPFFQLNCNFPGAATSAEEDQREPPISSTGSGGGGDDDGVDGEAEHAPAAAHDGPAGFHGTTPSSAKSGDFEELAVQMEARVAAAVAAGLFDWFRLDAPSTSTPLPLSPPEVAPAPQTPLPFAVFPGMEDYIAAGRVKHRTQHAALLGVMSAANMLESSSLVRRGFVELGAGKGGLAGALKHVLPDARVVAVDQELFRDMCDRELRQRGIPIERVCMNVKDFSLPKFTEQNRVGGGDGTRPQLSADARWVVCGKHLCGGCTDFSLFAAVSADAAADVCIATCCHHRCTWDALFADKSGGSSQLFRDAEDFGEVVRMTSWATGGQTVPMPLRRAGRAAKLLIDAARIAQLKASKAYASVRLVQYVTSDFTEEYNAIVATTADQR